MVAAGRTPIVVDVDPLIRDLVSDYLASRARDLERIGAAMERGDFATIRRIGHNMQGSGGSFGFDELSAVGGELARAASAASRAGIAQLAARLEAYLSRVVVAPAIGPESLPAGTRRPQARSQEQEPAHE
jgi:HPt (histidine-containing phosphotransfer) domain-containing protein